MLLVSRRLALLVLSVAAAARAQELAVMTSGAFTEAFRRLAPEFERTSHIKISTIYGASMGGAPDSIPSRLARGESADIVILAAGALDDLIRHGQVIAGSRADLCRSSIGMAMRTGASRPDIRTIEALKHTLLSAKSIAYSASASGTYLATDLFPRLGIADQIKSRCQRISNEPVGAVVARGDAEIGFQQMSELRPVKGIEIVGPLPPGAQRVTVFSAGIATSAKHPVSARELIQFLASPAATHTITDTGLELPTAH